jgi:hypothetical protein
MRGRAKEGFTTRHNPSQNDQEGMNVVMTVTRSWHASKLLLRSAVAVALLSSAALMASAVPSSAASAVTLTGFFGTEEFNCAVTDHNVSISPVYTADNGCGTRVWLHGDFPSGFSACISPGEYETVPTKYQDVQYAQVTSNTAAC